MICPGSDSLVALVHGEDEDAIHAHVDRCDACRRVLAEATRDYFQRSAEVVDAETDAYAGDRYVVLDVLGAGANGVVYAAFDRKLDRKVALKLVHRAGDAAARAIVREAKVLARLAHPNVVTVHDVGTLDGQVFVAMELVDGGSLTRWLAEAPRSWRAVVEIFVQAARGLAAAHAAGIVHRDFKPDNVLVGRDGRVRVADFGLARLDDGGGDRVVGTLAYAAPEQLAGGAVDARADQFSVCVALYEALYGESPFAGATLAARRAEIEARRIRAAPAGSRVPAWLRVRAIRGMAPRPDDRFSSLDALADALVDDPRRRRLRVAVAAFAMIAVAGYAALPRDQADPCGDSRSRLVGIWDDDRRAAVAHAYAALDKPYAPELADTALHALDGYADRWAATHRDACVATRVRGERSEALLDLEMSCLAARREELRELTDLLARGDPPALERAVAATSALTRLDRCANVVALSAPLPAPTDPVARARIERVRADLATARARDAAGHRRDALPIVSAALAEARRIGFRPVEAETLLALGKLHVEAGDVAAAEAAFVDAVVAAEAGRHDDALAQAMGALVYVVGYAEGRYADGETWQRHALAIVERLGGDDATAGRILDNAGAMRFRQGRYDDAAALHREALTKLVRTLGPDHLDVANCLNNLGAPLEAAGHYDDALAVFERALAIYETRLGPHHPDVALALNNTGAALRDLGKLDAAVARFERALAIDEAALGPDHVLVAAALANLANTLKDEKSYDRALELLARALAIRTRHDDPLAVAVVHRQIADVLAAGGRFKAAFDEYRQTLELELPKLGADHPRIVELLLNRADAYLRAGDAARARDEYTSVRAKLAAPAPAPALARYAPYAAAGLGESELALHASGRAIALLDEALAIWDRQPGDLVDIGRARFALARAHWASGNPARAVELARRARAALAETGPAGRDATTEVEAWLASR